MIYPKIILLTDFIVGVSFYRFVIIFSISWEYSFFGPADGNIVFLIFCGFLRAEYLLNRKYHILLNNFMIQYVLVSVCNLWSINEGKKL